LRGFEQKLSDFTTRGVPVLAISVDPPETNRSHCRKQGYTYTFLSDPRKEVIRRYGVLHPGAGPGHKDIARPAEFVVDSAGTIRWENFTDNVLVRARPEEVLRAIDDLGPRG